MQTLIIILIVVLIAQTVIFTYSNIVDDKRNKQLTSFQEQMKNAQADYIAEKRKFEKIIESLKNRVQPEKEWSEEDDYNIQCMIAKVTSDIQKGNVGRNNELIDWIKSLRPQNTWKPSDAQMERLKGIINALPHQEVLYSLYHDLKNLKG